MFLTVVKTGKYFAIQYQQSPAPVGGAMVKTAWLTYDDPAAPLPRFTTKPQSWDTANKSGELNDFSVCSTRKVYDRRFYLLDVFREHLHYPSLKRSNCHRGAVSHRQKGDSDQFQVIRKCASCD